MKTIKEVILGITLLSSLIFFQGCGSSLFKAKDEYRDITISKVGDVSLEDYKEVTEKRYMPEDRMDNDYIVDDEGNIVYIPRIGLHINHYNENNPNAHLYLVHLIPCSSTQIYEYIDEDKVSSDTDLGYEVNYNEDNITLSSIYYRIDKLRELEYIAKDSSKQEDLCLFAKWKKYTYGGKTGGGDVYTKSNKLRYTAKEINAVVAEYDKGGFSEYDGKY